MTPASALYSLRSEIDASGTTRYRITKFVDGEVESSYHVDRSTCECPAGVRPTCRHRQMLPQMLNDDIANTHWFLDWDNKGGVVDFEGVPRSRYEFEAAQSAELEGLLVPLPPGDYTISQPDETGNARIVEGEFADRSVNIPLRITHPWRRL